MILSCHYKQKYYEHTAETELSVWTGHMGVHIAGKIGPEVGTEVLRQTAHRPLDLKHEDGHSIVCVAGDLVL